jgi:hypothetical protein
MISSWNEVVAYSYNEKHSGERGVFFGGQSKSTLYNNIEYITILTTGNVLDFGDLTQAKYLTACASNGFIGIICGGSTTSGEANTNAIEKITFSIKSNAVNVGDLSSYVASHAACGNNSRMLFGGGDPAATASIKYIEYSSTSSSHFFGNLINNDTRGQLGSSSNNTIGIFCNGGNLNIIDYVHIMTLSNAVDFGDSLTTARYICSASSDTRAVFHLGLNGNRQLQYITYSTMGNAILFGTLGNSGYALGGCSNQVRGIFGGGTNSNIIEYITISTLSNASNFGYLTQAFICPSACSGD